MNALINILILWIVVHFSFSKFLNKETNSIKQKIILAAIVFSCQLIYRYVLKLLKLSKKKKFELLKTIEEAVNRVLFIILGLLIFEELQKNPNIIQGIEGLSMILQLKWIKPLFLVLPIFVYNITISLLKPH